MRVFIAMDIDEVIREDLADLLSELRGRADVRKGDVKWVNPSNVHLTLKFIGETKDAGVVEICNITKEVASRHGRFDIDVEGVGSFGGKSARVLWVGAGESCEELLGLQEELEEELASGGWPKETRKYSAHLTLCRVKNPKAGFKLAELAEEYKDFKLGTMPGESICVYQSELTPSGPIYTLLGRYELH